MQSVGTHTHTLYVYANMHWLQIPVGPPVYLLYKGNPNGLSCQAQLSAPDNWD